MNAKLLLIPLLATAIGASLFAQSAINHQTHSTLASALALIDEQAKVLKLQDEAISKQHSTLQECLSTLRLQGSVIEQQRTVMNRETP